MPAGLQEMPIFPIETVLFPEGALQLYISEEPYRQLVRDCLEKNMTFGIVLIRSESESEPHCEPFMVGTSVHIEHLHDYADGRFDIRVHGDQRFRIRRLDYSKPYLVGHVESVEESPFDPLDEAMLRLVQQAKVRFERFVQGVLNHLESNIHVVYPDDPVALTFKIANMLQIENVEKQRLLESVNTQDRLEKLIPILDAQLENLDIIAGQYQTVGMSRTYKVGAEDLRQWAGPN